MTEGQHQYEHHLKKKEKERQAKDNMVKDGGSRKDICRMEIME